MVTSPVTQSIPELPQWAELTPEAVEQTSRLIRQQRGQADALIEELHQLQELYGYLPRPALVQVARELQLPLSRIYDEASFYHRFRLTPPAAHRCATCLRTACFVHRAAELARHLEQRLGIRLDGPGGYGRWRLERVSCLGGCGQAQVLAMDGRLETRLPVDDPEALNIRRLALGIGAGAPT